MKIENILTFVQPDLQAIYVNNRNKKFYSDNNKMQSYYIGVLIEGKAKIIYPDKILFMNSGDVFVAGRNSKFTVEYSPLSEFYDIRFSSKIYRDIDRSVDVLRFFNHSDKSIFSDFLYDENFKLAVKNLYRSLENFGSRHFVFAGVLNLILEMKYIIEKDEQVAIKETDSNFAKITFYTHAHLSEKITLKELSEKLFISERCITNNVRRMMGCSYHEFLNNLRVENAKKMIIDYPSRSLASIADLCGFESYSSFYRNYIKKYGETPNDTHRKHNREIKSQLSK